MQTRECRALTAEGQPCKNRAGESSDWCQGHDPARREERVRHARKGGEAKARSALSDGTPRSKETRELRDLLRFASAELLKNPAERRIARADAIALGQLINVRLRLVETERKLHEQDAFEARLAELEAALKERAVGGGRRHG